MKTVYKYLLEFQPEQVIEIPVDFQILDIQKQFGVPHIWVLVNSENPLIYVQFYIYATGEKIKHTDLNYVGTYQYAGGNLVYHIFYRIP